MDKVFMSITVFNRDGDVLLHKEHLDTDLPFEALVGAEYDALDEDKVDRIVMQREYD